MTEAPAPTTPPTVRLIAGEAVNGSVEAGGLAFFQADAPSQHYLAFQLEARGEGDPVLELYRSDGSFIALADDCAADLNPFLWVFAEQADTYELHASYLTGDGGDFTLTYDTFTAEELEITFNRELSFDAASPTNVEAFLTSESLDSWLALSTDGGGAVADDDCGDGLSSAISQQQVFGPRLLLPGFRGAEPASAEFAFTFAVGDSSGFRYDFFANEGQAISTSMLSSTGDSFLELIGPDGATLLIDDDSAGNLDAGIETFLPTTGNYVVVGSYVDGETHEMTVTFAIN